MSFTFNIFGLMTNKKDFNNVMLLKAFIKLNIEVWNFNRKLMLKRTFMKHFLVIDGTSFYFTFEVSISAINDRKKNKF